MTTKARELLEHGLKDMYDAEQRFVVALGPMMENAHDRSLADGFRRHREVTREQVKRLERAFEEIGSTPKREECSAAKGLVKEYEKFVQEEGAEDGIHDTFAATAGMKVEHYEIASYRALIDLAEFCDYGGAAKLLKQNLAEEEQAAAEMQSAATKLSGELAGASTAEIAQRALGSMVDQAREGTLSAVGGVRVVGERAVTGAKSVLRKAERRGRKKLSSRTTTTTRKPAKRKAVKSRATSKGTRSTTNRAVKSKATTRTRKATPSRAGAKRSTRPASRTTARRSATGRAKTTGRRTTTSRRAAR